MLTMPAVQEGTRTLELVAQANGADAAARIGLSKVEEERRRVPGRAAVGQVLHDEAFRLIERSGRRLALAMVRLVSRAPGSVRSDRADR